jgi:hypothetical protein
MSANQITIITAAKLRGFLDEELLSTTDDVMD